MATLTDRPKRAPGAPQTSDRPPAGRSPQRPAPRRRRQPTRLIGAAYLLAPIAAVISAVFALAAVVAAVAISLSSGPAPPATGAADVVPASSLLYLHVSTDPGRPEVAQALARGRRLNGASSLLGDVTGRLDALLSGSSGNGVNFAADIRPWLGREAAFAVLDTPGSTAGTLVVLDVRNRARARAFLTAQGATPAGGYRNVRLLREPSGTALAFVRNYLVAGQMASVTSAIDVATKHARSLADSSAYQAAAASEPADRVLDLYLPVAGVRRALVPRQGLLGALGTLLDQPALEAVAATLSPSSGGFRLWVHSTLAPGLARATAPQSVAITPSLADVLPAGSLMLLDAGNLRRSAPKLLAAAAKIGVAGRASTLLTRLGGALVAQGVNLNRLFSAFGSESALAVVPGAGGAGPAPLLIGRTAHPRAASRELASLEGPLTQAFTPPSGGAGVVPEVGAVSVGGATVSELTLAPGLQVDWAVARGLVMLSTSPAAIAHVITHRAALSASPVYRAADGGLPPQATSLVFLDLGPLLRLGSQTGLIGGSTLAALTPELDQIRAIGLATTRGESDTTTELQLQMR
jgi:hypothetical protein